MKNGGTKDEYSPRPEREGRTIIFVNPHSGRGKSTLVFQKELLPLLQSREVDYQLVVSDQQADISKFIQNLTTDEINHLKSIVVLSGDGALHEIINAIMNHKNWRLAIKVPIGIIPTGSGNGLAYTLIRLKYSDLMSKSEAVKICCEAALQSQSCKTDLVKLSYGKSSIIWSFLSIGWGLLAGIDIDSEWLRSLGDIRFTIYGLLRSVTFTAQTGRLSFKIAKNQDPEILAKESNSSSYMYKESLDSQSEASKIDKSPDDWIHIEDSFTCLYAVYQSHISSVTKFAPKSTLTDRLIYLTYIRGKLSPCKAVEFLLKIEDGSHDTLPYVRVVPVTTFKFQPLERSKVVVDGEVIAWDPSHGPITAEIAPESMNLLWA